MVRLRLCVPKGKASKSLLHEVFLEFTRLLLVCGPLGQELLPLMDSNDACKQYDGTSER